MSLLNNFASAMASQAFGVIGAEMLTIGNQGVPAIGDVVEDSREYTEIGYEPEVTAGLVAKRETFDIAFPLASDAYLGKIATFRGRQFRIQSIKRGQVFVEIGLTTKNRS